MADNITASLPSNLLTTRQYEEQQAKLLNKEDDLDRNAFLTLFTTQLKNQNPQHHSPTSVPPLTGRIRCGWKI